MKIVINALSARIGGGRTYLTNLLENLPAAPGLEVHLFTHPEVKIAPDPRIRIFHGSWFGTNPLLRTVWERLFLPAYLRRVHADILFCPGGLIGTTAPRGCRTATMFRNMLPFDPAARKRIGWGPQRLRNWLLRRLMLRSMSKADLTIFVSGHARRLIESMVRIPNPVTIPHGMASIFRTFDREVARPWAAGDEDYLLYVSRFEPYKHHREVVQAFALLPDALRNDVRLVLVGETYPPEAKRVQRLTRELGIADRVTFVGATPYEEIPAFYRHAKAIVFASSCENCPNILLEALGAGRPLLSSNIMPMPEFGGPDIAYFAPDDPEEICGQMQRALTDEAFAARLSAASAERSLRYNWKDTAGATWAELLKLAGEGASQGSGRPVPAERRVGSKEKAA